MTASYSGYTTVTLPKDAHYRPKTGENPYFEMAGSGRFVGVLLVRTGGGLQPGGQSLFVGRYSFCGEAACEPTDPQQFLISRGMDEAGVLPAGEYRLFFVNDGAPASVRLRFDGLAGRTTITPKTPLPASVGEPETAISATANVARSYGRQYDFHGVKGFNFRVLSIQGETWAAGRYGTCIYREDPILPPKVAYSAPECPGGLSIAEVDAGVRTDGFRIDHYAQTIFDPGKWTVGTFYEAAGVIDAAQALDVAVDMPVD
ncbi:MAG TPA: hypothetical protein VHN37_15010 [Actinomycetota bacterium]|nr:hypothetical protein [Actinomycetota bacterium]